MLKLKHIIIFPINFLLGIYVAQAQSFEAFKTEINARFKDSLTSPLPVAIRDTFKQLPFYAYSDEFVIRSIIKPTQNNQTKAFQPSIYGIDTEYKEFGTVEVALVGKVYVLTVFAKESSDQSNPKLLLPFTDLTNGVSTFGGGRYIDVELLNNLNCVVDFNRSYAPSCAYNSGFLCPLVPMSNTISIEVKAGVKDFPLFQSHDSLNICQNAFYHKYFENENASAAITIALKALEKCNRKDSLYGILAGFYGALDNGPLTFAYADTAVKLFPDAFRFKVFRAQGRMGTPLPKYMKDSILSIDVMMDAKKFAEVQSSYYVDFSSGVSELIDYKAALHDMRCALMDTGLTRQDSAYVYGTIAAIFGWVEMPDSALKYGVTAVHLDDSLFRTYMLLAEIHALKGNIESVKYCLDKAVVMSDRAYEPYELRARFRLHTLYDKLGACRDLRKAISLGLRPEEYPMEQYCE